MIENYFEIFLLWFRFLVNIAAWLWAVVIFLVGHYGDLLDIEDNHIVRDGGVRFRDTFLIVIKVLMVAVTTAAASPIPSHLGPASVQYMDINPVNGQYSFGYTSADSSREERRNTDGSVEGKYSYTDPDGKLIHVTYGANSKGFTAYGDHLPPVDTPAVREAKNKFMAIYARELARVNGADVVTESLVQPQEEPLPDTYLEPTIGKAQSIHHDDDSEVIISATELGNAISSTEVQKDSFASAPLIVNSSEMKRPAQIYYINYGVAGTPYYMTMPFHQNTNFLIPIHTTDFRGLPTEFHDMQVPNYGQKNLLYSRGKTST